MTGGRTQTRHQLSVDTILRVGPSRTSPPGRVEEARQILTLCRERRRTVAELAGTLGRPAVAVRVLVADLIDTKELVVHVAVPYDDNDQPTTALVQALIAGLRRECPNARDLRHAS
ncbi:DUF742 domain-containing protein [Streptomyces seoulensis]|uniref:DUF742 domain-containing protein n=1 Tax=Streptomyces seoulensis TaxID=73044 RepID=UPI001FCDCBA5